MTSLTVIDATTGFAGDVLGPVPLDEAASRIVAYCTSRYSGWSVYDLAGVSARAAGFLTEVSPWSLLLVNALNGRVDIKQIADFDRSLRREFAALIGRIPPGLDLHAMTDAEISAVAGVCQFGFGGAWAPKITKLAALYRPAAVPVLDGHVAMAFGYRRGDLSTKVQRSGFSREERIAAIVRALAEYLRDHRAEMKRLRLAVAPTVPELAAATEDGDVAPLISDLRLLDIVVWTAMDDRLATRAGQPPKWLGRPAGAHIPYEAVIPEPVMTGPAVADADMTMREGTSLRS